MDTFDRNPEEIKRSVLAVSLRDTCSLTIIEVLESCMGPLTLNSR